MSIRRINLDLYEVMRVAYDQGYAVVTFTPEELGTADKDEVMTAMIKHGWDAIDSLNQPLDPAGNGNGKEV